MFIVNYAILYLVQGDMMKKIKVSVIVPVYNVEKYLEKCLDSLGNQTLKEIEIIVVNDGSIDLCQKIIDNYQKKYPTIKGYLKENGGVSDARNFGIAKAKGEYIAFVDGDDYVLFDMYEKMYEKAKNGNFDIVVCDLNYVYANNKIKKVSSKIKHDTTNIRKTYIKMYPCVWNKIIKKEVLTKNNIVFKKGVWFEDVDFLYKLFPYVKTIGVVKEPFNQYVQRPGSITYTFNHKLYDYIKNFNELIEFYKERNLYKKYKKELEFCYVRYIYATFLKRCINYSKDDYDKAVLCAIKNVKEHFPNYRFNLYFYTSFKGIYLVLFNKFFSNLIFIMFHNK